MGDGTTGLVQGRSEHSKEDDGCDDRLEAEKVLDFVVGDAKEWQLEQEV